MCVRGCDLCAQPATLRAVFMQDDFRLCPLALLALQHIVRKVSRRDAEWLSVRVSFGLAGVLVRNDNHDLLRLADHLQRHQLGGTLKCRLSGAIA